MQTHTTGIAWFLRAVLSILLLPAVAMSVGPVSASVDIDLGLPVPLDLSSAVVLPEGAANGVALWGDYDSDGDLDLLVNGTGAGDLPTTILWKNTGGVFTKEPTNLPNVEAASAAWGDYDNDNDLDLLIMGQVSFSGGRINGLTRIYRNDSGTFTHLTSAVLPPIYRGWGDWGDYDNDGDLDLLLSGNVTGGGTLAAIYRNEGGGNFVDSGIALPGVGFSHATWGDFDNDNDLDLAIIGLTVTGPIAGVYRQTYSNGPQFSPVLSIPGMWNGTTNWVDLDNDGSLELMLTGNTSGGPGSPAAPVTRLFRYNNGSFQEIDTDLPDVWTSSASWGDYDNDGDPDLAINGLTGTEQITRIYRNDGSNVFAEALNLPRGFGLSTAWGNFDGDASRALDLAVSGQNTSGAYTTQIYRGFNIPSNAPPAVPTLNAACWDPNTDRLLLDWSSVSDDHTATPGITYALMLGTTPSGTQITSPGANLNNGFRRSAQPGPMFAGSNAILRGLNYGRYYWSVQAVDSAFTGGLFSSQGTIEYGLEIGVDDSSVTVEGVAVSIPVIDNDDESRGPLEIYYIEDPAHGTAVVDPNDSSAIRYTPDPNFFGLERFYYHPRDPNKYCSRAYVDIIVLPGAPNAPTDITLNPASVNEEQPPYSLVGRLTTEDSDNPFDEHTYSLVPGAGSDDNNRFYISSDRLLTAARFDYEVRSSYSIRIRSTDSSGASVDKIFIIQINDLMESPPVLMLDGASAEEATVTMSEDGKDAADQPDPFVLTLSASDSDPNDLLYWAIVAPAMYGTAQVNPAPTTTGEPQAIYYTPDADSVATDSFVVQVTDRSGLSDTITVYVNIAPVNDPPRIDPLYDVTYPEWSGPHSIPLIGLAAGPPDETESVTATVETDLPSLIPMLTVVETSPGVFEIRLRVLVGAGPARITLTLDDGQPDHNISQHTFYVYTTPAGSKTYLPILHNSR